MKKRASIALIPSALVIIAGAVLLFLADEKLASYILLGVGTLAAVLAFVTVEKYKRKAEEELDNLFMQNSTAVNSIITGLSVPCVIFNTHGKILWRNNAFKRIYSGRNIKELDGMPDPSAPPRSTLYSMNGMDFQIYTQPVKREGRENNLVQFQYWIDRTEAIHYKRIFEERVPCVALIYVDNYEELAQDKYFAKASVMSQVEKYVAEFAETAKGIYVRYENTRFLVVFERSALEAMEQAKFDILERIRDINTGTPLAVTLSISVGVGDRLVSSNEMSRQAMELALGRGGDQAVVKAGAKYSFFGGKRQTSSKTAMVKTRLFSRALRQMIENSGTIYIMGHKRPDMDAMGASLGLLRCCTFCSKKAYILLDEVNSTIENCVSNMKKIKEYDGCILTPEQLVSDPIRKNSMLIVVDAQREGSLLAPGLFAKFEKTVIIDHHRRAVDVINDATLNYMEAGASSTCEMVTEIVQYFDENLRPTPFECSAMLAGIIVDTKSFSMNSGTRTFEAASYLRRKGADMHAVKLMFQDDLETYKNRTMVVNTADIIDGCVAIAICPQGIENSTLICAQAADELISIKGIKAAFVLVQDGSVVNISGRSLGDINVQLILERLGGGGHLNVAGAQVKGSSEQEVLKALKDAVSEYLAENPQK